MKLYLGQEFKDGILGPLICHPYVSDPLKNHVQNYNSKWRHNRDQNTEARGQWVGVTNKQAFLGIF